MFCAKAPSSLTDQYTNSESCMAESGSPVFPFLAVGGYEGEEYTNSRALIMTFIVNNFADRNSEEFKKAEKWESKFLEIMGSHDGNLEFWDVAYFSERSIEDVIEEASLADLNIFVISYILIFLYIILALGRYQSMARIPIDAKITVAVCGIFMILLSAFAATGIFGWAGVASNMIGMVFK
jgi:hypothetical protein